MCDRLEALTQKLEEVFEAEEAAEATAAAELAALCVAAAARALELARSAEAQFTEARLAVAAVAEASAAERAAGEAVPVAVPAAVALAAAAEAAADPVSKPEPVEPATPQLVVEKAEAERLDVERLATEAAAAAEAERLAAEKSIAEWFLAHPRPTSSSVHRDPEAAGPAEMGVASSVRWDPDHLWRGDPGPISAASYPTLPDSTRASSPVRSALRSSPRPASARPASARPASTMPPASTMSFGSTRGAQQPRTLRATDQKHLEAETVHLLLDQEWPLKTAPDSGRAPAYWVPLLPAARAARAQPAASAEPRAMPKAAHPPASACTSAYTCACTSTSDSRSAAAPSRSRPANSSVRRPRTQEKPRTVAEANATAIHGTEIHITDIHSTLEVESGSDIEDHRRSVSPPKQPWEDGMSSLWESAESLQPRPPVAVESPRPRPRPKPMRIELPPSSARRAVAASAPAKGVVVMLGGRPVHMPRPRPREPISQQDVYALLLEQNDPKTELARQRAAERVVAIQIAEGRIARQSERAERLVAKTRDAAERTRFAKLFGLPFRHNRCHSRRPLLVVASGGDAGKAKEAVKEAVTEAAKCAPALRPTSTDEREPGHRATRRITIGIVKT